AVTDTFFASFRVSVLFDANGANTTAAAAVLAALEGLGGALQGMAAAVLGGTGPVGQRVARLLARLGANVEIGSRSLDRAQNVAKKIGTLTGRALSAFEATDTEALAKHLERIQVVVCAGAPGVVLLPQTVRSRMASLKVAIDLNAVPPLGIEGVAATDRGTDRDGVRTWGALGVGATKMKIHKAAIKALFAANDKILDAEQVLDLGREMS
ncbi:MAG TPA: NAD(P)-binding domain-containing protein, partial [Isosphaeraceae bacterium]|nr:NAD(P)-binding domain-containing protein [Isosphaeraceae bacterium]